MATLLQLFEQIAEPTRDHAARGGAAEQAAQSALENVAKATTKTTSTGHPGIHRPR